MNTRILLLAIVIASNASAQDSARTKTLSAYLPFRGVHVDMGGTTLPYLDHRGSGASGFDGRISLPLRRFPDWSVAFATTAVGATDTTSYVVPASVRPGYSGYHPRLNSMSSSFEIERRWQQSQLFHGIASAGVGTITNSYTYSATINGVSEYHEDERTLTSFASIAGGGELNIARWMRASFVVGYRSGGRMKIAQAKGANGGLTSAFDVKFGKF